MIQGIRVAQIFPRCRRSSAVDLWEDSIEVSQADPNQSGHDEPVAKFEVSSQHLLTATSGVLSTVARRVLSDMALIMTEGCSFELRYPGGLGAGVADAAIERLAAFAQSTGTRRSLG